MKKIAGILLVSFALLLAAQPAKAQLKFGVVGGLNVTKLSLDNVANNVSSDNRAGWYIGPKAEFTIPLIGLGVDASLQYSQRRLNADGAKSDYYKSIEIPVNLRYSIGLPGIASIYAATGPQFGFNVGSGYWKWNDTDQYKFKNSNVTWNIGVGTRLLNHLDIGVGYNFALGKLATEKLGVNSNGSFKGNTFQLQVAYMF